MAYPGIWEMLLRVLGMALPRYKRRIPMDTIFGR